MKTFGLIIIGMLCTDSLLSQDLETIFSVESRGGYSTNTYLHPFVNEWDSSDDGMFARIVPAAQIIWDKSGFSAEGSAGYLFESIFDNRSGWSGGFGSARVSYRFSGLFSAGVEASGSSLSSKFTKEYVTVLPGITWSPSAFTRVRAKAGTSYRKYSGFEQGEGVHVSDRLEMAGLELEHWPSLRWKVQASAYGLPGKNVIDNHSIAFSLSRLIWQNAGFTISASVNRFTNSFTVTPEAGGSPFGPARPGAEEEIVKQTDHLLRSGVALMFPVAQNLRVSGSAGHHTFWAANGEMRSDIAVSLGLRYTFSGSSLFNRQRNRLEPEWDARSNDGIVISVNYTGDGDLYLTGDFNNWEQPGVELSRQNRRKYAARVKLDAGIYEYKVILIRDGEKTWIELSEESMTVSDGFGGTNGLIFVEE